MQLIVVVKSFYHNFMATKLYFFFGNSVFLQQKNLETHD